VLVLDRSIDAFGEENPPDVPFGEDFFLAPHAEELAERAARMRTDNRDAIRHGVDVAAWESMVNPELTELKEVLMNLLYNCEGVEVRWIAEAFCMDVRQVCEVAESHPMRAFNCLCCGRELRVRSRTDLFRLNRSLEAVCEGAGEDAVADLLCRLCSKKFAEDAEAQRRLARQMHQALLAEYRRGSYAERRTTKEYGAMRNFVLARAKNRCQLCGVSGRDVQLNVHHNTYENYGQERLEDLIVLCRPCHARHHSVDEAS
jgi:5-methylcytosine-specific restriction endonuclease McrA